jgi:DNA-binding transcriptional LysR family regulator
MDEGEALVEAARAGLGIAQVPTYMASPALADGSLIEVLSDCRPAPDPIHAVHVSQRNPSLALRMLIEFLAALPELRRSSSPR